MLKKVVNTKAPNVDRERVQQYSITLRPSIIARVDALVDEDNSRSRMIALLLKYALTAVESGDTII